MAPSPHSLQEGEVEILGSLWTPEKIYRGKQKTRGGEEEKEEVLVRLANEGLFEYV